jgi:integrase/recombinase XerD
MSNRRLSGLLNLRSLIDPFIRTKIVEGITKRTQHSYRHRLNQWIDRMGLENTSVLEITRNDIIEYISWLSTGHTPKRLGGNTDPLSMKTIRNEFVVLRSFFNWASELYDFENPTLGVKMPRYRVKPVEPFTLEEVRKLIQACDFTKPFDTTKRRSFVQSRPNALRDRAIILTLFDTGLRAEELCHICLGNISVENGKIDIVSGEVGGTKGGKGRTVYIGVRTRKAIFEYLKEREGKVGTLMDQDLLFVNRHGKPLNYGVLNQMIRGLGKKTGIDAHTHKFRHTFAINFLRQSGNVFTLQALLGHNSLDMVKRYTMLAEPDLEQGHRKAGPVDNLL